MARRKNTRTNKKKTKSTKAKTTQATMVVPRPAKKVVPKCFGTGYLTDEEIAAANAKAGVLNTPWAYNSSRKEMTGLYYRCKDPRKVKSKKMPKKIKKTVPATTGQVRAKKDYEAMNIAIQVEERKFQGNKGVNNRRAIAYKDLQGKQGKTYFCLLKRKKVRFGGHSGYLSDEEIAAATTRFNTLEPVDDRMNWYDTHKEKEASDRKTEARNDFQSTWYSTGSDGKLRDGNGLLLHEPCKEPRKVKSILKKPSKKYDADIIEGKKKPSKKIKERMVRPEMDTQKDNSILKKKMPKKIGPERGSQMEPWDGKTRVQRIHFDKESVGRGVFRTKKLHPKLKREKEESIGSKRKAESESKGKANSAKAHHRLIKGPSKNDVAYGQESAAFICYASIEKVCLVVYSVVWNVCSFAWKAFAVLLGLSVHIIFWALVVEFLYLFVTLFF